MALKKGARNTPSSQDGTRTATKNRTRPVHSPVLRGSLRSLPRSESTMPGDAAWQKRPSLKAKLCARTDVLAGAVGTAVPAVKRGVTPGGRGGA